MISRDFHTLIILHFKCLPGNLVFNKIVLNWIPCFELESLFCAEDSIFNQKFVLKWKKNVVFFYWKFRAELIMFFCSGNILFWNWLFYILNLKLCFADTDECADQVHDCSQLCNNAIGSFGCDCQAGYTLNADGKSCDGMLFAFFSQYCIMT